MLNKEEKRFFEWYIKPAIEKVLDITMNYKKIYKTNQLIDSETDGETGLWVAFSDIWDLVFEMGKYIKQIYNGNLIKKLTHEQLKKRFNRNWDKTEKLKEEISKETIKKFKEMEMNPKLIKLTSAIQINEYKKGIKAGVNLSKREPMTNKEILLKAKILEAEMEVGLKPELKKEMEKLKNKK